MTGDIPREGLVGESQAFRSALQFLSRFAASEAPVLLMGETGTGKELFARAIHYESARRDRPFVPLNCAAVPDTLLENELFGHERGAYTGAGRSQEGLVALAHRGTLFLDEVDSLSPLAQVKLLRLLQDGEYRPLGSLRRVRADIRVVSATNSELFALVQAKRFREDLYHRLHILPLAIPPLRERMGDIMRLAHHFLNSFSRQYQRGPFHLSAQAEHALERYAWPGNVRELQSTIHRAVVIAVHSEIGLDEIALPGGPPAAPPHRAVAPEVPSFNAAKRHAIQAFERDYLASVLVRCSGNVTRAARCAGKERRAFQRLLDKHGLKRRSA